MIVSAPRQARAKLYNKPYESKKQIPRPAGSWDLLFGFEKESGQRSAEFGGLLQGPVLQDFDIGLGDAHRGGGLFERKALEEAKLKYAAVIFGQGGEQPVHRDGRRVALVIVGRTQHHGRIGDLESGVVFKSIQAGARHLVELPPE